MSKKSVEVPLYLLRVACETICLSLENMDRRMLQDVDLRLGTLDVLFRGVEAPAAVEIIRHFRSLVDSRRHAVELMSMNPGFAHPAPKTGGASGASPSGPGRFFQKGDAA